MTRRRPAANRAAARTAPQAAATEAPAPDPAPEPEAEKPEEPEQVQEQPEPEEEAGPIEGVPEIKPEPKFGEDPDDLVGADNPVEPADEEEAELRRATVYVRLIGVHTTGKPNPGPIAATVIVPESGELDYETMVTAGRTYTLRRNQPQAVDDRDVEWLTGHPHYLIETVEADD